MALYVDTADLNAIAEVCAVFPVSGVTTNPSSLLAAIERGQRLGDMELLTRLLAVAPGIIFMQPMGDTADQIYDLAARYIAVAAARVVPKLPMTAAGLQAGLRLKRDGARIAFTAVYTAPQAFCAAQAGADWVIPYIGRLRRAGLDPCQCVEQMARLLASQQSQTRILAASVKSPSDLVEATLAGAHDITAQPEVIRTLADDSLTQSAQRQFAADWERIGAALAP